jgi:5-methylcytosine-specific restriction endonuclease McrA
VNRSYISKEELNKRREATYNKVKLRYSYQYRLWKRAVLKRDNRICVKCGEDGSIAHHLDNFTEYQKLRFNADNGVTLCKPCHRRFHLLYGNNNNTIS